MIKWLCYKIISIGSQYGEVGRDSLVVVQDTDGGPDMEKAIRFAVLPARGGCVMETRVYDKKEREWDVVSHVIPEGADVAKQVGDIVAMELLRR
jgi:hypothetical protein